MCFSLATPTPLSWAVATLDVDASGSLCAKEILPFLAALNRTTVRRSASSKLRFRGSRNGADRKRWVEARLVANPQGIGLEGAAHSWPHIYTKHKVQPI